VKWRIIEMRCEKCAKKIYRIHYEITSTKINIVKIDEDGLRVEEGDWKATFRLCKECWLSFREWLGQDEEPLIEN
jgi:hypothetical protein